MGSSSESEGLAASRAVTDPAGLQNAGFISALHVAQDFGKNLAVRCHCFAGAGRAALFPDGERVGFGERRFGFPWFFAAHEGHSESGDPGKPSGKLLTESGRVILQLQGTLHSRPVEKHGTPAAEGADDTPDERVFQVEAGQVSQLLERELLQIKLSRAGGGPGSSLRCAGEAPQGALRHGF
jgi:hypothetical protein